MFQLYSSEPLSIDYSEQKDYTLEIRSITTSYLSILWGLSSYKINVSQREPKLLDKFVLMVRSSVDITVRLIYIYLTLVVEVSSNNQTLANTPCI